QGLLTSTRSPSGQRTYVDGAVERVRLVQHLYAAGLPSRTIAELLPCVDAPSAEQTDETWARLLAERERLDARIADLLQARDALDAVVTTNRDHRETYAEKP
ncbi:MerR family DNA-binding protein, partial [Streptomyces sp. 049-1]